MTTKSLREKRREKKQREKMRSRIMWGALAILIVGLLGLLAWNSVQPRTGEEVPIMADSLDHSDVDILPDYSTDPPTSGPHYATPLRAGFYDQTDELPVNADGYLVHNLEHGYIIFWYNCGLLDQEACSSLKDDVRGEMERQSNNKLVAVPRDSTEYPLVLTSWGRMLELEEYDRSAVRSFISTNRNRAPEPGAP